MECDLDAWLLSRSIARTGGAHIGSVGVIAGQKHPCVRSRFVMGERNRADADSGSWLSLALSDTAPTVAETGALSTTRGLVSMGGARTRVTSSFRTTAPVASPSANAGTEREDSRISSRTWGRARRRVTALIASTMHAGTIPGTAVGPRGRSRCRTLVGRFTSTWLVNRCASSTPASGSALTTSGFTHACAAGCLLSRRPHECDEPWPK